MEGVLADYGFSSKNKFFKLPEDVEEELLYEIEDLKEDNNILQSRINSLEKSLTDRDGKYNKEKKQRIELEVENIRLKRRLDQSVLFSMEED